MSTNACTGVPYPFVATSLEPLKYDAIDYSYDKLNGEDVLVERRYYLGSTLQFSHVLTYDADGNLISLSIV